MLIVSTGLLGENFKMHMHSGRHLFMLHMLSSETLMGVYKLSYALHPAIFSPALPLDIVGLQKKE
jgi:hypothetical protein